MKAASQPEPERMTIVDLTHDGRGVARGDGKIMFVEDALPGETVDVVRLRRRRNHDEGRAVALLEAAADRVDPICAHFGVCGGCSLQHLSGPGQMAAKHRVLLQNLERIGKVVPETEFDPLSGPAAGYRRRARLGDSWIPLT